MYEKLKEFQKLLEFCPDPMVVTDHQAKIQAVNGTFSEVTGYGWKDVMGKNPRLLQSGRHEKKFYRDLWASLLNDGYWAGEIWNRRKNGEIYPEWLTITAIKDSRGCLTHYLGVFKDITSQKLWEERLTYMAYHDALTELPNRFLLHDRLKQALALARRRKYFVALLSLDLDGFKLVNDSCGHTFGDALLKSVAERLTGSVREGDTVARTGGDEFVIILAFVEREQDTRKIAENILTDLALPFKISGQTLRITGSIGISIYPADGSTVHDLMKHSDAALYRAKAKGKSIAEHYSEVLDEKKVCEPAASVINRTIRKNLL